MDGSLYPRRSAGRGRGQHLFPAMEMWENRPGRTPGSSWISPDVNSGNYKLHVRSIPFTWTDKLLRNVFSRVGEPESVYLHPHKGPNTLSWGFVEYATFEEARSAVEAFNNNVMLDIQVSFAREKPSSDVVDPVLQLLNIQSGASSEEKESLVDPKMWSRTVINDNLYSANIVIEKYILDVIDRETQNLIDEAYFHRVQEIWREGDGFQGKCQVCEASCSMACFGCTSVFYCSEICQNGDWASHSRTCKMNNAENVEDNTFSMRGDGDNRTRSELLNGYRSTVSEKENRSDNRFNKFDKANGQFDDSKRDSGARFNRDRTRITENGNNQQKRHLFEERKSRFSSSGRKSENDDSSLNHPGQNNQKFQNYRNGQETRQAFKPDVSKPSADEDWGSTNKESNVKDSSDTTLGIDFINEEQAFLQKSKIDGEVETEQPKPGTLEKKSNIGIEAQTEQPKAGTLEKKSKIDGEVETEQPKPGTLEKKSNIGIEAQTEQPKAGTLEKVTVVVTDEGFLYIHLFRRRCELSTLCDALNKVFSKPSLPFSPVKDGICGVKYEDQWYRCKITNLDPLTVIYLDFGYPETVEADRLFTLPPEFISPPPFALKIKFVNETSAVVLSQKEGDELTIKLLGQKEDHWLAQLCDLEKAKLPEKPISETVTRDGTVAPISTSLTEQATQIVQPCTENTPKAQAPNPVQIEPPKQSTIEVIPVLPTEQTSSKQQVSSTQPLTSPRQSTSEASSVSATEQTSSGQQVSSSQPLASPRQSTSEASSVSATEQTSSGQQVSSSQPLASPRQSTSEASSVPATEQTSSGQQVSSSQPLASIKSVQHEQQSFPAIFDTTKFTTLTVTWPENTEQKDTYYVGAPEVWETLAEMCSHFEQVIRHCDLVTPKNGVLGLALFDGAWYRAKVVSLSPLLAYYIDCGNIAPLAPEGLRKCPETHKDIPHLVHKVKLAPGTSSKYFNLPELSTISVKPVSWLADGTVVVQVEGENYTSSESNKDQQNSSSFSSNTTSVLENPSLSNLNTSPNLEIQPLTSVPVTSTNVDHSLSSGSNTLKEQPNQETHLQETICSVESAASSPIISSNLQNVVDLLQEGWKVMFLPCKVDLVKNSLVGQVYCQHVPETFEFMTKVVEFENHMSTQKFDPSFKPSVGDVVVLKVAGGWVRGKKLPQEGLIALHDQGGVVRNSQMFKLPEQFDNIPPMAVVLTVHDDDQNVLNLMSQEIEITLVVSKVDITNDHKVVRVKWNFMEKTIEGELRAWDYEPLETPEPLSSGDLVTILKFLDSNTVLVAPPDDIEIQQSIQIDCTKSREDFKSPLKVGDYVAFFDKDSNGFFRCRVDSIDKGEYELYSIDDAYQFKATLPDLRPLPSTLRSIPCRITQIELEGVKKVNITEQARFYISHICDEDKCLDIGFDDLGQATLTVEGEGETINKTLNELLKPKVVPDSNGKFTISTLSDLSFPLNQEVEFFISQTDPLYVQPVKSARQYYFGLHRAIQEYCSKCNESYNPCDSELCLAKFDGDWYRCRCLRETNAGISSLMLVDFGNMFNAETRDIRRIPPEMLTMPSIAISCKVKGLPHTVSPELRARLNEILAVDTTHTGICTAENDQCFEVEIQAVNEIIFK